MVRSPKSGVNFFSLGDFEEQLEMACVRAQPAIHQVSAPARVHALLRQAWSSRKSDSEAHKPALHPRVVLHAWGNMMAHACAFQAPACIACHTTDHLGRKAFHRPHALAAPWSHIGCHAKIGDPSVM